MPEVYIISDNIVSPIGHTTDENFACLTKNISGISLQNNQQLSGEPFYASLFNERFPFTKDDKGYTRFEQLLIASINDALKNSGLDPRDPKTVLVISSTKGNIELLGDNLPDASTQKRIAMHTSAKLVAQHFGFHHQPLIVSNACISGLMGILIGKRLIESGQYDHAVIAGADTISKFVLSGFQSFQAISSVPCKPFDKNRNGISLGEGSATVLLSRYKKKETDIRVMGGGISNDANHISAPSRTGDELGYILQKAMHDSGLRSADIDFISAHGTATLYNDEMEAKAITGAGLKEVPTNSLKGYYGHTLGAAGLIESIISVRSLKENIILPTKGFEEPDPTAAINITTELIKKPLQNFLKTASGFGGCNAAVAFGKQ